MTTGTYYDRDDHKPGLADTLTRTAAPKSFTYNNFGQVVYPQA